MKTGPTNKSKHNKFPNVFSVKSVNAKPRNWSFPACRLCVCCYPGGEELWCWSMVSSTVKPSRECSILSSLIRYWSVYPQASSLSTIQPVVLFMELFMENASWMCLLQCVHLPHIFKNQFQEKDVLWKEKKKKGSPCCIVKLQLLHHTSCSEQVASLNRADNMELNCFHRIALVAVCTLKVGLPTMQRRTRRRREVWERRFVQFQRNAT